MSSAIARCSQSAVSRETIKSWVCAADYLIARSWGVPARPVSQYPEERPARNGPSGTVE